MTKRFFPLALVMVGLLGFSACKGQVLQDDGTYPDPFTKGTLYCNTVANTLTFTAVYNDAPRLAGGTWHCIVNKEGAYGAPGANAVTPFSSDVTPHQFYQGLLKLGAEPGENVTGANAADQGTFTEGTKIEVTVTWSGAAKTYALSEFLQEVPPAGSTDTTLVGIEMRFGGNRDGETDPTAIAKLSDKTGCLMCLYSCAAGVTSNAKANKYLMSKVDGGKCRFVANPDIRPADGTVCTITVKVTR